VGRRERGWLARGCGWPRMGHWRYGLGVGRRAVTPCWRDEREGSGWWGYGK